MFWIFENCDFIRLYCIDTWYFMKIVISETSTFRLNYWEIFRIWMTFFHSMQKICLSNIQSRHQKLTKTKRKTTLIKTISMLTYWNVWQMIFKFFFFVIFEFLTEFENISNQFEKTFEFFILDIKIFSFEEIIKLSILNLLTAFEKIEFEKYNWTNIIFKSLQNFLISSKWKKNFITNFFFYKSTIIFKNQYSSWMQIQNQTNKLFKTKIFNVTQKKFSNFFLLLLDRQIKTKSNKVLEIYVTNYLTYHNLFFSKN